VIERTTLLRNEIVCGQILLLITASTH
jgi:hypothetical protein